MAFEKVSLKVTIKSACVLNFMIEILFASVSVSKDLVSKLWLTRLCYKGHYKDQD